MKSLFTFLWSLKDYVTKKLLKKVLEHFVKKEELEETLREYPTNEEVAAELVNYVTHDELNTNNEHYDEVIEENKQELQNNITRIANELAKAKLLHVPNNGQYQADYTYSTGALAAYNSVLYLSIRNDNLGHTPGQSPDYWVEFAKTNVEVDLSDYLTEQQVNELLSTKADRSELTNVVKTDIDNTYAQGKRNIFRTIPEVYTERTLPTKNTDLTTKKYVDDAIAGIPSVDLTNVAKLNTDNTFRGNQKILNDGSVTMGWNDSDIKMEIVTSGTKNPQIKTPQGYLNFKNRTVYDELPEAYSDTVLPTKNTQLTTKKYVDNALANFAPTSLTIGSAESGADGVKVTPSRIDINGSTDIYFNNPLDTSLIYGKAIVSNTASLWVKKTPTNEFDATNKKYVDDKVYGAIGNGYVAISIRNFAFKDFEHSNMSARLIVGTSQATKYDRAYPISFRVTNNLSTPFTDDWYARVFINAYWRFDGAYYWPCISIQKIYDKNSDLNYYKDNIQIIIWNKHVE